MKGEFLNKSSRLVNLYQFRTGSQYPDPGAVRNVELSEISDCWQIAASSSDLINQAMEHTHILPLALNLIFSIFV